MPSQAGTSDSLVVTTYQTTESDSVIIDKDSTQFTVTVASLVSDDYNSYSLGNSVALGTGQSDFNYRVKTTVALDGTIKLDFRGLTLNSGTSCSRKIVSGSSVSYVAYTSSVSGSSVTITLTASTIPSGTTGEIECTSLINLPSVST